MRSGTAGAIAGVPGNPAPRPRALSRERVCLSRSRPPYAQDNTLARSRGDRRHPGGTSPEEDLLRAAIVFTGACLDATLKQLIRDTLPILLETNQQAHDKFEAFAAGRLGTSEIADTKMIARYLTTLESD
jgi:hypothetical protein